jgi:hypothetical protein
MGRNPATGEAIKIKASKKVASGWNEALARHLCSRFACGSAQSFIIKMAERTQIQLQAVTHMFFSHAVPVQRSRSARLRLENARRS